MKCLYLARMRRPDNLWSVNKLARAITKWTKSCDKRLARLISYIHHTSEYQQYCNLGNTAQQCRLGLFQESERLKINIRRTSVKFRKSHACANKLDVQETDFRFAQFYRSWNHFSRCRFRHGRFSRSHSLGFVDWSISFRTEQNRWTQEREPRRNPSAGVKPNMHNPIRIPTNVGHIPSNTTHSGPGAVLHVFEDNEAVIKMIIKGRSPTMRHVSRTHRVALERLFDRINLDPKIQTRYIDTQHQLAVMLTKGNFTRVEQSSSYCVISAISAPFAAQRISAW